MFIQLEGDARRLINIYQIKTVGISCNEERTEFFVLFIMFDGFEIESDRYPTINLANLAYDVIYNQLVRALSSSRPRKSQFRRQNAD